MVGVRIGPQFSLGVNIGPYMSQYFVLERKMQRTFRLIHRHTFYFETDAIVFCLLVCWQGYEIESQVTA